MGPVHGKLFLQGMACEVMAVMQKTAMFFLLVWLAAMSAAWAGYDAACVPENRIPWSGYWWPKNRGELVVGYSSEPSPLEKYDALVSGYYPGPAMEEGRINNYDPAAPEWHGLCDAWAAASILEPEPDQDGSLVGIPFRVGDKKGLISAFYRNNYSPVIHGSSSSDFPPGGSNGFHQTLINYISYQGLPIAMDADPGPEVWSYPVYRYQMEWTDNGLIRHVTCTIWMANDFVPPDFVGTASISRTYTYSLDIDALGGLLDTPGEWTHASVDDHPDVMWFPSSVGDHHAYLDENLVRQIAQSTVNASDDRFEPNNTPETAHFIREPVKGRYYWGSARNEDWYRVTLEAGRDFYAHLLSPAGDLVIGVFDASGIPVGEILPNGARIRMVEKDGLYDVRVLPAADQGVHYNIAFYSSPADVTPHVAVMNGWSTAIHLTGREAWNDQARINLFGADRSFPENVEMDVPVDTTVSVDLENAFGNHAAGAETAGVINLDADVDPSGFFSYSRRDQLVNIPFGVDPDRVLIVPRVDNDGNRFTGIALMNTNVLSNASVRMTVFNREGNAIRETTFSIGAGRNRVGCIDAFGPMPSDAAWIRFSADQPLQGVVLWWLLGEKDEAGLCGIPLLRTRNAGRVLYLPHLAATGRWRTEVSIVNPNQAAANITVSGYSGSGRLRQTRSLTIGAKCSWRGAVQQLFGSKWEEGLGWAKIESDLDVSGVQVFERETDALAAMPIPVEGDATIELTVPYLPDARHDWLGLVLLNAGEQKNDIWAAPLDEHGNSLTGQGYLWYNVPKGLEPSRNAVGLIEELFPNLPPGTRTLKIFSRTPLLGFGIYGESIQGDIVDMLYLH